MKAGVVMRIYPTIGQLRQEHCHKFKVRLSYIARHFPFLNPSFHLISKQSKQTNKKYFLPNMDTGDHREAVSFQSRKSE